MKRIVSISAACTMAIVGTIGCKSDTSVQSTTQPVSPYSRIYGATSITTSGEYVTIETTGLPDHKSPYYKGTAWEDSLYQAYNGTNTSYMNAPGHIAQQSLKFKLPLHPVEAATKQATPLGPIGVALNGVPFFNQYAGNGASLGPQELNTFDQYNGHPTPMNAYHYHAEPWFLTANKGSSALLGFLLDGFPVYGPVENGKTITNADLDVYHGHTSYLAEYGTTMYHYHVTATAPYINGDGFYGTPGTVGQ